MEITFEILKDACKFTGDGWKDGGNCNHTNFAFSGEFEDDGYVVRSNQQCEQDSCPFLSA